jgi:hypothetical protein
MGILKGAEKLFASAAIKFSADRFSDESASILLLAVNRHGAFTRFFPLVRATLNSSVAAT